MSALKNTIVTVTLLVVGYGAYVVLNDPPTHTTGDQASWTNPQLPTVTADVSANHPNPTLDPAGNVDFATDLLPQLPAAQASPEDDPTLDHLTAPQLQAPGIADHPDTHADHSGLATTGDSRHQAAPNHDASLGSDPNDYATDAEPPQTDPGNFYARNADPEPNASIEINPVDDIVNLSPSVDVSSDIEGDAGFEEAWKAVLSNLDAGRYADALFALSIWYDEQSLSTEQSNRCVTLLDQLAGTVIYSKESYLEPAHVVQDGETLETLAQTYNVPAEFLARINGVQVANEVVTGQSVKVLRGPFRAEISVDQSELTLFLGRYYAGRFQVRVGSQMPSVAANYEVITVTDGHEYFDRRSGERITREHPNNPYGNRWIGLRGDQITAAHNVGLHVDNGTNACCIGLNSTDADDLSAILSIGSRVTVRR